MFNLREPEDDDREFHYEAELRAERERQHAPAPRFPPGSYGSPPVSSAMATLAWTVLNGNWHDARDASRALAEMVLEASETASPGEG